MTDLTGVDRACSTAEGKPKVVYLSRTAARRDLRKLRQRGQKRLCVYECPRCGRWHIGHIPHRGRPGTGENVEHA